MDISRKVKVSILLSSSIALSLSLGVPPGQAQAQGDNPPGQIATIEESPLPRSTARAFPNMTLIYRASGVIDNRYPGYGNPTYIGSATVVTCTNFSTSSQYINMRFVNYDGTNIRELSFIRSRGLSYTVATHAVGAFPASMYLVQPVSYSGGSLEISATSPAVICSAVVVDSAGTNAAGISLHLVRFNPYPGTQE